MHLSSLQQGSPAYLKQIVNTIYLEGSSVYSHFPSEVRLGRSDVRLGIGVSGAIPRVLMRIPIEHRAAKTRGSNGQGISISKAGCGGEGRGCPPNSKTNLKRLWERHERHRGMENATRGSPSQNMRFNWASERGVRAGRRRAIRTG
jgi:hypothetical protein